MAGTKRMAAPYSRRTGGKYNWKRNDPKMSATSDRKNRIIFV
jgi:hypothetical protein